MFIAVINLHHSHFHAAATQQAAIRAQDLDFERRTAFYCEPFSTLTQNTSCSLLSCLYSNATLPYSRKVSGFGFILLKMERAKINKLIFGDKSRVVFDSWVGIDRRGSLSYPLSALRIRGAVSSSSNSRKRCPASHLRDVAVKIFRRDLSLSKFFSGSMPFCSLPVVITAAL